MHVHEFMFRSARGVTLSLERWTGQPILIVNTASESQHSRQLEAFQRLYQEYQHSGLVVLGVPCNDFEGKEPLDGEELDAYYWENHRVNFPLTQKYEIIGRHPHPLFISLREEYTNDVLPQGNFYKYLFSRDGELLEHWPTEIEPDDSGLHHQIERNVSAWCL